nr:hypothetical protein GZ10C7_28 [uncultured archaeon GZfos10C7]
MERRKGVVRAILEKIWMSAKKAKTISKSYICEILKILESIRERIRSFMLLKTLNRLFEGSLDRVMQHSKKSKSFYTHI